MTSILHALDTFWFSATWGDWVVVLIVFVAMAAIPTLIAWDWLTPVGPPDPVQEQAIDQALTDLSRHHARVASIESARRRRELHAAATLSRGKGSAA